MKTKTTVAAWLALTMSVLAGAPATAQKLEKVTVVIPQNSVFVLNYNGGKDAGIFKKRGIDLNVDARPFAGFLAGLPSKQTMAVTYSGIDGISKMNQGLDLAVVGGGLTVIQQVFVRKDSPIKSITDLRGKRLGVWATGAGAVKAARAAILDSTGMDIVKDTKLVQLAPPALFKLLEKGDVDAMINISSFTMKALSQPDKFRSVFSPNDYWKKKTGYPVVWAAPIIAWKSWVNEDKNRAKNLVEGIHESFRWLRDPKNLDAAVKSYGKLAGVTDPAQVSTYKKLLANKGIFLAEWDQKAVDAEWQFLELVKKHGILEKVPDKTAHALILGQ